MKKLFKNDRIMVFGVFDGLHPGHRAFLKQAKRYGKELIVVVARDSSVQKLKNKNPRQSEKIRVKNIRAVKGVTRAVLGDCKQGTYIVIKKYKPDIICLGYDQQALWKDLQKRMRRGDIPELFLAILKSHHPRKFKSSLLLNL